MIAAERTIFPAGHVIHMSLDHTDRRQSYSVAQCDCGWLHRAPWPGHHVEVDAACEAHWQDVEKEKSP